jgi:hypothetical protein
VVISRVRGREPLTSVGGARINRPADRPENTRAIPATSRPDPAEAAMARTSAEFRDLRESKDSSPGTASEVNDAASDTDVRTAIESRAATAGGIEPANSRARAMS